MKVANSDLEDLEETVQIVESNPQKYSQFEEAELKERRKFVDDTKTFLKVFPFYLFFCFFLIKCLKNTKNLPES